MLKIEQLQVDFRQNNATTTAVHALDLTIAAGEVVALVGESGSGKSVSAQSIMRLLPTPPAHYPQGRILWKGEDCLRMGPDRLRRMRGGEIGMIFQEPMTALNPVMRVGDQVAEAIALHRPMPREAVESRVIELFTAVGIPDPARRIRTYPHEMSGGQRQRVCIAMALACDPQLLIADEPTTALDVTIQAQILDLVRRLQRERGMAVLFITHDLGIVHDLADRVVVLRHGRVQESGPVREVFANPQSPYTRALLACRPKLGQRTQKLATVEDILAAQG